jgi:serine O-acetyltransferase
MNYTLDFLQHITENKTTVVRLPSQKRIAEWVDDLISLLFPIRSGIWRTFNDQELLLHTLETGFGQMLGQLTELLPRPPDDIVNDVFESLPHIYDDLRLDAQTIEKNDPAAASVEEVIITYPGFYAIAVYRIAHLVKQLGVPSIPRMMSEYAHMRTGIDIHPGAKIGKSFCIDHGTGIVIGETTEIGDRVKMYQGVTLGALSVQKEFANTKRHPTIEDNVVLYSGSTILGGTTVVGHDSVIGGNVWLTESVLPYSIVYHKSEVHIRNEQYLNEPIDFII